jgi:hypothetical protein
MVGPMNAGRIQKNHLGARTMDHTKDTIARGLGFWDVIDSF